MIAHHFGQCVTPRTTSTHLKFIRNICGSEKLTLRLFLNWNCCWDQNEIVESPITKYERFLGGSGGGAILQCYHNVVTTSQGNQSRITCRTVCRARKNYPKVGISRTSAAVRSVWKTNFVFNFKVDSLFIFRFTWKVDATVTQKIQSKI